MERQRREATADALAAPRTELNSFTLHAPLELLARAELGATLADEVTDLPGSKRFFAGGNPVEVDVVQEELADAIHLAGRFPRPGRGMTG